MPAMTKDIEMRLTLTEILMMIRHRIKLVLVFCVLCAMAGACIGLLSIRSTSPEESSNDVNRDQIYQTEKASYEAYRNAESAATSSLKREWTELYEDHKNNPLFTVNPFSCDYEQIVLRFSGTQGNHDGTVSNWIAKADDQSLFGTEAERFADYKNSLILLNGKQEDYSDSSETVVQIICVDGFDTETAMNYLVKHFRQQASKDEIGVDGISTAHIRGRNENVALYKKTGRDAIASAYNTMDKMKNAGNIIQEPVAAVQQESSGFKTIIKYLLVGLILGLGAGAVVAVFLTVRKGCVTSQRQIRESFDLEMISDCSDNKTVSIEIMNANLDLMTKEGSEIAVINLTNRDIAEQISGWNSKSKRTYYLGQDVFTDTNTIEILQKTEGVVLGIRLGESRLDDMINVLLHTKKLNRMILGYVLV